MDRVRRSVPGSIGAPAPSSRNAAGVRRNHARAGEHVDGLKSIHPAVLREVVEEQAEAPANHGCLGLAGRVGEAEARTELFAVILRSTGSGEFQGAQREQSGILELRRPEASNRPNVVSQRKP